MATHVACSVRKFSLTLPARTLCVIQVRWSRYNKLYLDPTISKDELSQTLDESDPRRFQPIKAARSEQTVSSNYDALIQKFIGLIIKKGKKTLAREIMDKTLANIKMIQLEKYHKASTTEEREAIELNPKAVLHQAVENCKPLLITQNVKRGGVIYQVPVPVKPNYQQFKSIKWLIESSKDKDPNMRFHDKLAYEFLEASKNEGKSIKKKQDLHRLCEANRAYAHFRW